MGWGWNFFHFSRFSQSLIDYSSIVRYSVSRSPARQGEEVPMIPNSLRRVSVYEPITEDRILAILHERRERETKASNHQGVKIRHLEEVFKMQWSVFEKVINSLIRKNRAVAVEWMYRGPYNYPRRPSHAYFLRGYPDHTSRVRNGAVLYLPDQLPRAIVRFIAKAPNEKVRRAILAKRKQMKNGQPRS